MERSQREALLETGLASFRRKGFGATGVRQVAAAAGVPQGSFTNHFRSKDVFGLLVLDRYAARLDAVMTSALEDKSKTPAERLRTYFDRIEASLESESWRQSCLIVDLSVEAPPHSELIRQRLCEILRRHSEHFAAVCREVGADAAGDGTMGEFILSAWQGTLLRVKVERDATPIRRFRRAFEAILRHQVESESLRPSKDSQGRSSAAQ